MPVLKIQTNATVADERAFIVKASEAVADDLGKPERYVMVVLEQGMPLLFGGSDAPAAYLELKSIGLPEARTEALSASLAGLMERTLKIPKDRVYIEFANAKGSMWGWNGSTF